MAKSSDIRTGRHCVFNILVHLVFVSKYRKKVFDDAILKEMEKLFRDICKDFESELIEFNGEENHIHLIVSIHPKYSISKLVNSLKGVSSRILRKNPNLRSKFWKNVLWSPSYFAGSCGGVTIKTIKKYIKNQASPDSSSP